MTRRCCCQDPTLILRRALRAATLITANASLAEFAVQCALAGWNGEERIEKAVMTGTIAAALSHCGQNAPANAEPGADTLAVVSP